MKITKIKMLFFVYFLFINVNAQLSDYKESMLKLNVLRNQIRYSSEKIKPSFEKGKFYYFNVETNKKAFENGFEQAYPFIGKSAIVKNNKKFGVINLEGNYIISPKYDNFFLDRDDSWLIRFYDQLFDLRSGKKKTTVLVA